MEKLLVINPGSTSTKISLFHDEKEVFNKTIRHNPEDLKYEKYVSEQFSFRKGVILRSLDEADIDIRDITAIVGRGGGLKPLQGGTYGINEEMLEDCRIGYAGQHASNLGAMIAHDIANMLKIPAFVVDPPVVDEMSEMAKLTGYEGIRRKSLFHALNQKAVARKAAEEIGMRYENSNLIVAMLGGGVSVGIHVDGRVVDVNNCFDGEGPMSPERAGTVQAGAIVKKCFSSEFSPDEINKMIVGQGGVAALLGTSDMREVVQKIQEGDGYAEHVHDTMAYQVSKSISALAAVVDGRVDAIVISGGIAYDETMVKKIVDRVGFLGEIYVYPGEDEMEALAGGAIRVLREEEELLEYNDTTYRV